MINTNIYKRILSSLFIIPISFFLIIKGSYLFNFFLLFCLSVSFFEWHTIAKKRIYYLPGYIFLLFSFYSAYFVRTSFTENSLFFFIFVIVICVSTDIGGYIFGKSFKGPKLTKISPKKTYMGVLGGYCFSLVGAKILISYSYIVTDNNLVIDSVGYTSIFLVSTISQLGDIAVSYFKRLSNLKDTGNLIPGHGGILDRIDGIIFSFPFFYIYFYLLNF